jgi:hypothetical protein
MRNTLAIELITNVMQEIPADRAQSLLQATVNFLAVAEKENLAHLLVQVESLEDAFSDILINRDKLLSEKAPVVDMRGFPHIGMPGTGKHERVTGLFKTAGIASLITNFYDLASENDSTEYTLDDFNTRIGDQLRSAAEDLEDGGGASFDMTDVHFDVEDELVRSELNQAMHRVTHAIMIALRERDERNILDALNMMGESE